MKKYLIRKHCEATPKITIAQNREQNYYYGKGPSYLEKNLIPADNIIAVYGYDSIDDAKPKFDSMTIAAEAETKRGSWVISVTIEEFDVE